MSGIQVQTVQYKNSNFSSQHCNMTSRSLKQHFYTFALSLPLSSLEKGRICNLAKNVLLFTYHSSPQTQEMFSDKQFGYTLLFSSSWNSIPYLVKHDCPLASMYLFSFSIHKHFNLSLCAATQQMQCVFYAIFVDTLCRHELVRSQGTWKTVRSRFNKTPNPK